jgi:hypothetical protein
MIKASHILEEYLTLYKQAGYSTPIYLNPTKSELRELGDSIRFIADSEQKKIYAGSAMVVVHEEIKELVHLKKRGPTQLWGHAKRKGDKYILVGSDELRYRVEYRDILPEYVREFFAQDWSWVNRYIDIEPYFDFVKDFMKTQKIRHSQMPVEITV